MSKNITLIFTFMLAMHLNLIYSQSLKDLQDMRKEYEQIIKDRSSQTGQNFGKQLNDVNNTVNFESAIVNKASTDSLENKFFGYSFFSKRDTIKFWENLPPPTNYILGPGDELILSLWGETQLRNKYVISKDGKIYDEKVGLLNLSGKTLEAGENYLKQQFSKVFSTLKGPQPSTYIDLSLGELRSINVTFVGNVKLPGVYALQPFSNVITGLIQAGGVDTTGSLRSIKLKRNSKKSISVDLYDYLLNGNLPTNIRLRDNDIIIVPPRISSVKINFGLDYPLIYEILPQEKLSQLIEYAGGIKYNTSPAIGIERLLSIGDRRVNGNNSYGFYVDFLKTDQVELIDGDEITLTYTVKSKNNVKIIGQVKKPGDYIFYEGMKLSELIELSGGLSDTTFWKSVYQDRAELIRKDPKTRFEKIIEVDLANIRNGKTDYNLQNQDLFIVHANLNYYEREPVKIVGEVNIPGSYPLTYQNENLNSLIDRAGGLTPSALKDGIAVFRKKDFYYDNEESSSSFSTGSPESDWIRVAWKNYDLPLTSGDSIHVNEATRSVLIEGEVYNPGLIEYQKNKSLNYYISSAGGVTTKGDKNDIIVIYSNGIVAPKRLFRSPEIIDGSKVIVNTREEKTPFDITSFATSTLSIVSTTVTILVLSQQLSNSTGN